MDLTQNRKEVPPMKMDHFVLGLVFNQAKDRVLLIEKKRPAWMAGKWNGIGGHIEENETPIQAMERECKEETGYARCDFDLKVIFTCPGGTVYVFAAISTGDKIPFKQIEDEQLRIWELSNLDDTLMRNLKGIIPLCLSSVQFPVLFHQNELGVV